MKEFLGPDFELNNETGKILYHQFAEKMPIFDYHCHLPIKDIFDDRKFKNITEVWLVEGRYGDHYKWRALRAMGVSEDYLTGDRSDKEKFMKWAEVLPKCFGNPLYLWAHMELRQYFGITENLSPLTSERIWNECNKKLETLTARKMIEMNNVKVVCTTDDPCDSLEYHIALKNDKKFKVIVLPAFRPDKALNIEAPGFLTYVSLLEERVGRKLLTFDELEKALKERIAFFNEVGCRISDHALDSVMYEETTREEVSAIYQKRLSLLTLTKDEIEKYHGYLLIELGKEYQKYGWAQQYHINAQRNNNSLMFNKIGPDTGFDAIGDDRVIRKLALIMDQMNREGKLPKTILYSLNAKDNATLAALSNCFNDGITPGKIQFGTAWWFNDQKDGMVSQLKTLMDMSFIATFVGMLTDSRSFLSYPRHDYFRRILCNKFGEIIESGEYPYDLETVGKMVKDICFNNAVRYFGIGEEA